MTLHNVIIHIKSVLNKDQNHYYYNIFLEKCSYRLAEKIIVTKFFDRIIIFKLGKMKVAEEEFYGAKKPIKV